MCRSTSGVSLLAWIHFLPNYRITMTGQTAPSIGKMTVGRGKDCWRVQRFTLVRIKMMLTEHGGFFCVELLFAPVSLSVDSLGQKERLYPSMCGFRRILRCGPRRRKRWQSSWLIHCDQSRISSIIPATSNKSFVFPDPFLEGRTWCDRCLDQCALTSVLTWVVLIEKPNDLDFSFVPFFPLIELSLIHPWPSLICRFLSLPRVYRIYI